MRGAAKSSTLPGSAAPSDAELLAALPRLHRAPGDGPEAAVCAILDQVRGRGAAAVQEFSERFDGVRPARLRVPAAALVAALEELDPAIRAALEASIDRARAFAADQLPQDVTTSFGADASVTVRWVPVQRVGLYVPGGLAVYPSSVIMNVVPAQAAGVSSVALVSPPARDGSGLPHPTILAAAQLLGVSEVYAMGGAQAIAALAYGLEADPEQGLPEALAPVSLITGPGNKFVATAKGLLKGLVGIDAEAGPTEIAILADSTANPEFVAADLISQAEHDPEAASVLITDSEALVSALQEPLARQVAATKHTERVVTSLTGEQSGVLLVADLDTAVRAANLYAAEHLEIHTADPDAVAERIVNAGAVFVGEYSPVSLGDYSAGSNHVLPTLGTALHASGLHTATFLKAQQEIRYGRAGLAQVAGHVRTLADAEDLPAHGDAVDVRSSLA
ncbi:histidinol dehydrogenase [Galactobacter caseinivorans]|uniref:Histidinol dehydrogenase n=1 Tax=Galactobacter caseinivorans TaxID=2676123 RepID=A0A496PN75_9MICC|nr:histidinol dehydrogenase [Galactobacter caseinivorans]